LLEQLCSDASFWFRVLLATLDRSIYDGNMAVLAELHNFQLSLADDNWMTANFLTELSSRHVGLSTDMQESL